MSDCNQRDYRNMRSMPDYQQRYQHGSSCSCNNNNRYDNRTGYTNTRCNDRRNNNCCDNKRKDTHCHHQMNDKMEGFPLAMGYVPWQRWQSIYEPEKAMERYTIFKELDKPFMGCRGGKR